MRAKHSEPASTWRLVAEATPRGPRLRPAISTFQTLLRRVSNRRTICIQSDYVGGALTVTNHISNHQFLARLEIAVTPRKQRTTVRSNRHFWDPHTLFRAPVGHLPHLA